MFTIGSVRVFSKYSRYTENRNDANRRAKVGNWDYARWLAFTDYENVQTN